MDTCPSRRSAAPPRAATGHTSFACCCWRPRRSTRGGGAELRHTRYRRAHDRRGRRFPTTAARPPPRAAFVDLPRHPDRRGDPRLRVDVPRNAPAHERDGLAGLGFRIRPAGRLQHVARPRLLQQLRAGEQGLLQIVRGSVAICHDLQDVFDDDGTVAFYGDYVSSVNKDASHDHAHAPFYFMPSSSGRV